MAMNNCGHESTPMGSWPGFMTDPLGYTWCGRGTCADSQERALMSVADVYGVYVRGDGRTVGTCTGALLGRITAESLGRAQYDRFGDRWHMRSVRVTTPDGREWWGRGSDQCDAITLHACANSRRG